ncbi:c-type cytochrome [bacterium]|nr:c-type cytochrome [bacterium]
MIRLKRESVVRRGAWSVYRWTQWALDWTLSRVARGGWARLGLGVVVLSLLAGCAAQPERTVTDLYGPLPGNIENGRAVLEDYGCGSCHTIPGVPGANSLVGPPLNGWAERSFIAGKLPNEPEHLEQWVRFPQAIEPGTAMPNMDVTEEDAVDMVAYLFSLRRDLTWHDRTRNFLGIAR